MPSLNVPYYCQWESADMAHAIVTGEADPIDDPLWAASGAATRQEYALWSMNVCGMACLKMILAALKGEVVPLLELARGVTRYGGYVVNGENIKGLIYAPFVDYLREVHKLPARIEVGKMAKDLPELLKNGGFLIASVHPTIRWPERTPPKKGGHLILVTAANDATITFHNPSGHTVQAQQNATLPPAAFDRFFAGRGIWVEGKR